MSRSPDPLATVNDDWPLVGRQEVVEAAVVRCGPSRRGAVALVGEAGVGKSRMAREVRARLDDQGLDVVHLVATPATVRVPLGVLAPLLGGGLDRPQGTVGALARAREALMGPTGRTRVVSVDDAHYLDPLSLAALGQVASEGTALLLTVRSDLASTSGGASLLGVDELRTLLVEPLARPQQDALVRAVLPGTVASSLTDELWSRAAGNPLVLRELLTNAAASGALVWRDGVWVVVGSVPPSDQLRSIVAERLRGASEPVRRALSHLALAEGEGHALLAGLVGDGPLAEAERLGFVVVPADGRRRPVWFRHPFHREVALDDLTAAERARISGSLAEAVAARGARRGDDVVRVAQWQLDSDLPVDAALLTRAARQAWVQVADELAGRFAAAAVAAGGGWEARFLDAVARAADGRAQEAEAGFASLDVEELTDRQRAEVAVARAQNLFWHLGEVEAADQVLASVSTGIDDAAIRTDVVALRLSQDLLAGRTATVVAEVEPLLDELDPPEQVTAGWLLMPARTVRGELVAAADLGRDLLAVPVGTGPGETRASEHLGLAAGVVFARTELGDLAGAGELGRGSLDQARRVGALSDQAWLSLMLGRRALLVGDVVAAEGWFADGEAHLSGGIQGPPVRWCLAGRLWCAAYRRDRRGEQLAERLEASGAGHVALMEPEVLRARAWWAQVSAGRRQALELLEESVTLARAQGAVTLERAAHHDVVRFGGSGPEAAGAAAALAGMEPDDGSPLPAALVAHGRAVAAGDVDAMAACADRFAALGASLFAAEVATRAAVLARTRGRRHAVVRRALELRGAVPGVITPLLAGAGRLAGDTSPLTERELEVATLAAEGWSNQEIGDELGCSPRTVESHLGRTYRKLGVAGRRDLRSALSPGS